MTFSKNLSSIKHAAGNAPCVAGADTVCVMYSY